MVEGTQEKIDGSEATYHKLKERLAGDKAALYVASASLVAKKNLDVKLTGRIFETIRDLTLTTELVLDWAKLAIEKRDADIEASLISFRNFVRRYTPVLEEADKDYGDKARRISKN